jgi:phenylpyruvate tautomerase PptA (4-oxalocrotonate tautomerase family)
MPLAKIHIVEGRYDEQRIAKVSGAIQAALMNTLRVPPEDFYQLIFELPKNRFRHTPSFVGMNYTDDLIILDVFHPGTTEGDAACPFEGHQHACRGSRRRVTG